MFKIKTSDNTVSKNSNSYGSSGKGGKVPSMGWNPGLPSSNGGGVRGSGGKPPATNFTKDRTISPGNSNGKRGGSSKSFGK